MVGWISFGGGGGGGKDGVMRKEVYATTEELERAGFARPKSIFDLCDGDPSDLVWHVPGTTITGRWNGCRLELTTDGREDRDTAMRAVRELAGHRRNVGTMRLLGMKLQEWFHQEPKPLGRGRAQRPLTFNTYEEFHRAMGYPPDPCYGLPREGAKVAITNFTISQNDETPNERYVRRIREVLASNRITFVRADDGTVLDDCWKVTIQHNRSMHETTHSVPHKLLKIFDNNPTAVALGILDCFECPTCGGPSDRKCRVHWVDEIGGDRFRSICSKCGLHPDPLGVIAALNGIAALYALPTPRHDLALRRVAEQCAAGGVDCDETRAAAMRRVEAELAVVRYCEQALRRIHAGALGDLAMTTFDNAARPGRWVKHGKPSFDKFFQAHAMAMFPGVAATDFRAGSFARMVTDIARAYEREWGDR